jgi:hypothetical protein
VVKAGSAVGLFLIVALLVVLKRTHFYVFPAWQGAFLSWAPYVAAVSIGLGLVAFSLRPDKEVPGNLLKDLGVPALIILVTGASGYWVTSFMLPAASAVFLGNLETRHLAIDLNQPAIATGRGRCPIAFEVAGDPDFTFWPRVCFTMNRAKKIVVPRDTKLVDVALTGWGNSVAIFYWDAATTTFQ